MFEDVGNQLSRGRKNFTFLKFIRRYKYFIVISKTPIQNTRFGSEALLPNRNR